MAHFHEFPVSSRNANIPIHPDTNNARHSPELHDSPEYCSTCETSSRDQPIHCISIKSPNPSPAPPSYSSIHPSVPTSRHLAVPPLTVETPQRWSEALPSRPHRAFRFDPEGRLQVRFRRNAFSPISPAARVSDVDWSQKSHVGLGIPEAQFKSDASPITPGTAEKNGDRRSEGLPSTSNFAHRIEQKLFNYSASGNVVKRWLLEIISWSISAICMAGIVAMLIVYKDARIPKLPLGLTLNAYISVLAKVASGALLLPVSEALGQLKWSWFQGEKPQKMWDFEIFDSASRGPWGSMLLLIRTKGKSLAALGAIVTVFALALDPFFQQVVEYPEHWRAQLGNGSVSRATSYLPYHAGKEYRIGGESLMLDYNMMGAVHHFFYDKGITPITFGKGVRAEIPVSCPSSNCTWPEFETLGICSACEEASDLLEFRCHNRLLDWIQVPGVDKETGDRTYTNGTSCGWWLKADEPLLMTGYNIDRDTPYAGEVLLGRAQPIYDIFTRAVMPGYQSKINDTRNPISHGIIVSGLSLEDVRRNSTPIAHECMIKWCVKKMISSYSEGAYTETITKLSFNNTLGPSPWVTNEIEDDKGEVIGYQYEYNENITVQGETGFAYQADSYTHILTMTLFDDVFPSTYSISNSTKENDAILRYKQYITFYPYTRNITYNPFMQNNISTQFDNMVNAMTNLIRSDTHTEMVLGPAYDKESFVDVRWGWLALPLGLLSMSCILLVATIIRSYTEQEHVGVWKTSAIATLLYGLPDHMQSKIASSKDSGTPLAKAKDIKAEWLPQAGWRFSGNAFFPTSRKSRQHDSLPPSWI
jgi:hypothetical protein